MGRKVTSTTPEGGGLSPVSDFVEDGETGPHPTGGTPGGFTIRLPAHSVSCRGVQAL